MNLKRIFGALLTMFGIGGIVYAAYIFVNNSGSTQNTKALAMYGIVGVIFFIAGLGLVRNTKDES